MVREEIVLGHKIFNAGLEMDSMKIDVVIKFSKRRADLVSDALINMTPSKYKHVKHRNGKVTLRSGEPNEKEGIEVPVKFFDKIIKFIKELEAPERASEKCGNEEQGCRNQKVDCLEVVEEEFTKEIERMSLLELRLILEEPGLVSTT
ncbi:stress response protein NST1-like [Cucumis melo var. makuwa]|uniref:Stress response protein NST1-like n=1 Tax=Cucumis melo var. makuwa TaxID=1194695 RepID=A0A5A7SPX0_CUCMM|nr:stress response protein NST1-like [Cucumis melo var. makuwa]